jgi:hypothetical protein
MVHTFFFPFYSYSCYNDIEPFFQLKAALYPNRAAFWQEQTIHARNMHTIWEQSYHLCFARNQCPFPKCLWYHKCIYAHERHQSNIWSSFFLNTPFRIWEESHPATPPLKIPTQTTQATNKTPKISQSHPINNLTCNYTSQNSNGTGDYPPPASTSARVNDSSVTQKKIVLRSTATMSEALGMRKSWKYYQD